MSECHARFLEFLRSFFANKPLLDQVERLIDEAKTGELS